MSKRIGLRHLRHFLTMSEHLSMTRAAEALNTVQPALSRSLRELEAQLDTPLFHRTPQGLVLTPAGEDLLQHIEGPLAQIREGLRRVKGLPEKASIRISMAPAISRVLGVRVLKEFSEKFPHVDVLVEARLYSDAAKQVREGSLDFAVGRLLQPDDLGGLSFEHLFGEPILFCARHTHPLASKKNVSIQEINSYQMVTPIRHTIIWVEIEKYLFRHGLTHFDRSLETSSYEMARTYLRATDAIGCMPRSIVLPELTSGEFAMLDIPVDEMTGAVGLTFRATGRLSSHARAMFDLFRDHARQVYS